MTTRYRCPISTCRWFFLHVATEPGATPTLNALLLAPRTWPPVTGGPSPTLSVARAVEGHLSTHSPVEWLEELRQYQARAEDAEAQLDRLLDVLEQTADVTAAVHPVTSMRLPSRAEVESARELLAGAVGGGGVDA